MTEDSQYLNEHDFYEWINSMGLLFRKHFRAENIQGMSRILGRLESVYQMGNEDPYLSVLETTSVTCVTTLATLHNYRLEFEKAVHLCARAVDTLEIKRQRYLDMGKKPRPDSLAWARVLSQLSDAKWKGMDELKDAVLTPSDMINRYFMIQKNVFDGLKKKPYEDKKENDNAIELLINTGIQVLKVAMKHAAHLTGDIKNVIGLYNPGILDDEDKPYYWNLKVTELFLENRLNKENAKRCYTNLKTTYRKLRGPGYEFRAFDKAIEHEFEYLVDRCSPQLRLMDC